MRKSILILPMICLLFCGCQMFQWIAPHQLWKLNRQPAIGGEDGYFSVPADPTAGETQD